MKYLVVALFSETGCKYAIDMTRTVWQYTSKRSCKLPTKIKDSPFPWDRLCPKRRRPHFHSTVFFRSLHVVIMTELIITTRMNDREYMSCTHCSQTQLKWLNSDGGTSTEEIDRVVWWSPNNWGSFWRFTHEWMEFEPQNNCGYYFWQWCLIGEEVLWSPSAGQ